LCGFPPHWKDLYTLNFGNRRFLEPLLFRRFVHSESLRRFQYANPADLNNLYQKLTDQITAALIGPCAQRVTYLADVTGRDGRCWTAPRIANITRNSRNLLVIELATAAVKNSQGPKFTCSGGWPALGSHGNAREISSAFATAVVASRAAVEASKSRRRKGISLQPVLRRCLQTRLAPKGSMSRRREKW
jgi:hypothetical protein